MQKKLIALAVAGMVAAPVAMAQSNVTIYGLFDIGLTHYSDSATSGRANRTGLDQGFLNGSRLGFRGTEDLGNGLKAGFNYEFNVGTDHGGDIGGGRQVFLTLQGGFGTVALGRQYTPQFNLYSNVDPFGAGSVGNVANISRVQSRLDNLIAYVSPTFSGFNLVAGYTFSHDGDEIDNDSGVRVWAINPNYSNGPLFVGLNYHVATDEVTNNDVQKRMDLGATYDFGVVKLRGIYGQDRADNNKANYWMVGATVPVSEAGKVMVSYNSYKDKDSGDDSDAKMWALGYEHKLSARTKVYAIYADVNNDGTSKKVSPRFGSSSVSDYQKGLQVAIQHRF